MDAKTLKGGAAAPAPAETAAGNDTATELTEEALARELATEDDAAGAAQQPNADADSESESGDENANAGADGAGSEGADGGEASDGDQAEATEEAGSEEDLSQEQSDTEGEGEAQGEDAEEAELQKRIGKIPKLTPEQGQHVSAIIKERVGKVTKKLRETEERATDMETRAAQAEARVSELEAGAGERTEARGESPLAEVTSIDALKQKAAAAQQVVDFCDDMLVQVKRNPQVVERELRRFSVKLTNGEGEEDYSPELMTAWLEEKRLASNRRLTREIPQRGQFLDAEKRFTDEAMAKLPWLKDAKNPKTTKFNDLVKAFPVLKQFPAWRLLVGRAVEQAENERAADAAKKNPPLARPAPAKARPVIPNTPVKGAKARPTTNGNARSAELIAAEKAFEETGSARDLERALALEG